MRKLRALAHAHLLPLVIGTLVLRALIPVSFMPGMSAGTSLTAVMCASPASNAGTERIEIPGTASAPHCDFCLTTLLGPPSVQPQIAENVAAAVEIFSTRADAPASRFALLRAQIPRAPPLA